jgi:hypothetical protein
VITPRHRKSGPAFIATLGVVLACVLVGPSVASANNVDCWGKTAPTGANQRELTYTFRCSEPLKGFSVISNLEIGEFATEVLVLDPTTREPVSGESFGCEGPIPGDGFGCTGKSFDPHVVAGTFGIDEARCVKRKNKLRVWVVAVDSEGKASAPQDLVVPRRCPKVSKQRRHR